MVEKEVPAKKYHEYSIRIPNNLIAEGKEIAKKELRSFNSLVCLSLVRFIKQYKKHGEPV